ncbi:MAG: hypothetical protein KGP29_01080 [Proteobacteria bacterium]|nr:hypothetical protein [Pseudomonadota bacterium]
MKKLTSIFCALILLSSQAQAASGPFIGIDALHSQARNKADNSSLLSGPQNDAKSNGNNEGYGANLGFRLDPLFLFASAEVFYERLNSSSRGFSQSNAGTGPNVEINDRYGAKANLGFTILPWLTPFLTYGVANVKYGTDVSNRRTAPLYGVGILFDIPLTNFSVKAAYDIQRFDAHYQNGQSQSQLGVARLGVTYVFGD